MWSVVQNQQGHAKTLSFGMHYSSDLASRTMELGWSLFLALLIAVILMPDLLTANTHPHSNRLRPCPRHCHCRDVTVDCRTAKMSKFTHFPSETNRLILDSNRLSWIPANAFQGLSQLTYLSVKDANLTLIDENAFNGLKSLKTLHLDGNQLQTLPENVFLGTPQLGNLSLSGNRLSLSSLNASVSKLPGLEGLILKNTLVTTSENIPSGFRGMTSLRFLELGSNEKIRNITEDFFEVIEDKEIVYIGLSNCPIVSVHPEAFRKLPHITDVDISRTSMTVTDVQNIFSGLQNSSIDSINLARVFTYTDVKDHLTSDFFYDLRYTELTILNMEGNSDGFTSHLHNGLFKWIKQLRHISLENSNIISVSRDAFKGLHKLKRLILKRNFISCVPECSFVTYGPLLRNLQTLDLSSNVISNNRGSIRFRSDVFPRLHHLYLHNNRISVIDAAMFDIRNLKTLDLSENPIHHIEADAFRTLHSLETLTVTGSLHLQVLPNGTFKGLRNLLHLRLNNNKLDTIHPRAFNGLHSLEVLEMNGNRIGGPENFGGLHIWAELRRLRKLDLGNNRLDFVPIDVIEHQPRLKTLILHYNRIAFVDKSSLYSLQELQTLDLSYNDITEVGEDSFHHLASLRHLDLAGNPFLCTCSMKGFLDWLRKANVKVSSLDNHKCTGPTEMRGKRLLDYRPSTWECQIKSAIIPVLYATGLIILTILVLCVTYKCFCRRHDHVSNEENKDRKGRNWGWIRELLPVHGDVTPSGSEEGNVEDPLIETEMELCQETLCQESQTDENHIL